MAGETPQYRELLADLPLVLVLLVSFAGVFAATAIPPTLPQIQSVFGVTEGELGLVMAVFAAPLVVMVPVTGVLADLVGRRWIVIPSLTVFGLAGVATAFVSTFQVLLALRALQGAAFAGLVPLTPTLIGDRFTGSAGSAAQGLRSSTHGIASTLGPLFAGFLAAVAWYYPFLLFSAAFPVALLLYLSYAEPIEQSLDRGATTREIRREFASYWTAFRAEAADPVFALLYGGGFFLFMVKRGIKTFVPVFAVAAVGLSVSAGGIILSVYGLVRIVVPPLSGVLVGYVGRKATIVSGFGLLALGSGMLPFTGTLLAVAAGTGLVAAGDGVVNPVMTDAVADLAGAEHRGGVMSGLSVSKESANVVSPVLLGVVITLSGYQPMFFLAGAFAVAYGLVFAAVPFPERREE